jgi:hypothetical protein
MARKERHDRSEHKVYDAATEDDIEVYVCQIHAGKVREKNSVPQILCAQHADRTDRGARRGESGEKPFFSMKWAIFAKTPPNEGTQVAEGVCQDFS